MPLQIKVPPLQYISILNNCPQCRIYTTNQEGTITCSMTLFTLRK